MIRKWDTDNTQLQTKCQQEIIARVQEIEDTDQMGVIAAQDIIDIVLEHLAPEIYDKGIIDASKVYDEKLQDAAYSLESLRQS